MLFRINLSTMYAVALISISLVNASLANKLTANWLEQSQMVKFAKQLEQENDIPTKWTIEQLKTAKHLEKIKPLMLPSKAPGKRNWLKYEANALDVTRINAGVAFAKKYRQQLIDTQNKFGVEPWVILGILGMETNYGGFTGNIKTLNALTTLAFDFPKQHPKAEQRQQYFQQELKTLLRLAYYGRIDLNNTKGSFAGAVGWPQFMPSSIEQYSVSSNNQKRVDLFNAADAIESIANYLSKFNWQEKIPSYYQIDIKNVTEENLAKLAENDIFTNFTTELLQKLNIKFIGDKSPAKGQKLALIKLENDTLPATYVVGSENFYCITRYNKSSYYAMAVTQLGLAVSKLAKLN